MDTTPVTARPAAGRSSAAVARVAGFVAALSLTAVVGWLVGGMVAVEPVAASGPAAAQEHRGADQHQGHGQHQGRQSAQQPGQGAQGHHHGGGLQLWATQTPALGIVTLDGAGRIMYRSDSDRNNPPASNCTGECAQRWVPVTVPEGQQPDLLGIEQERIGTIRRADGATQVTLGGWPLYTVAGDQGAHDGTGANGADGLWFAVTPKGEKAMP